MNYEECQVGDTERREGLMQLVDFSQMMNDCVVVKELAKTYDKMRETRVCVAS